MTDKQIIIDGVDVSGCKDRYLGYSGSSCQNTGLSCPDIKCENNKDCYYKQLQREKKKCKRLNKQLILFMDGDYCANGCSLKQQLSYKEQECEQLKNLLKVRIEDLCDSCGASSMMPMPCKAYEKTLIEIKEIIKQGVKIHDDIIVSKQILQKISECEVENA